MRVFGITETCDLGSMYLRLIDEGHEVRVTVAHPLAEGTMAGLVPRAVDWRRELGWLREAGSESLILFEAVGFGALQDELRRDGFNVIGGSAFGDRLESDRAFALGLLDGRDLRAAPVAQFASADDAVDDLLSRPRRCVFKANAAAGETFVGSLQDGSDIAALLRSRPRAAAETFILMDFVEGVETGVGAYFNGECFLRPACLDWEHKRFFAGDMGELTGEMGTVATFDQSDALFEIALLPLEPLLREVGHVGWVNLNTIINEEGVWPLELTCRFGYPGFAVLEPLQRPSWGELFRIMIDRTAVRFDNLAGFSVGVVITTPPFPHSRKEIATPIGLPLSISSIDPRHLHLGEVGLAGEQLVTSGLYGWTAVVTGIGDTIGEARAAAYANAAKVVVPNGRYRLDIGDKLMLSEFDKLEAWGWLKSKRPSRMASQIVR